MPRRTARGSYTLKESEVSFKSKREWSSLFYDINSMIENESNFETV